MAEDRLEGRGGGFAPTTPCPPLITPVRPLPSGRIPALQREDTHGNTTYVHVQ